MIQKRLKITLADLIEEAEELTKQLRDLQERHLPDLEVVTEDNRPIRFPLELNWRPYEGEPMPSPLAAEVIGWINNHLDVHVKHLTRYFVDWKERRDQLDRFPLVRHPNLPLDGLFACLEEHRDQLRIEEMKELAVPLVESPLEHASQQPSTSTEATVPGHPPTAEKQKSPIAKLTEEAVVPQDGLAGIAGIDRSTLNRAETRRMKPRPESLRGSTGRPSEQLQVTSRPAKPRWVTAAVYAESYGLSIQTLANWRHLDKKAGRDHAAPGQPEYRRFGAAVRYLLTREPPDDAASE